MCSENQTMVTELLLLGFQNTSKIKILMFSLIVLIYICTVVGNLLIILMVSTTDILHRPMYLFISSLALADLTLSNTVVPNMLFVIWLEGSTITMKGCITQYVFVVLSACAQCWLLMIMSLDRYLAICLPLRYSSIMTINVSLCLILISWVPGIILNFEAILIYQLQFCTSNVIDHFFCDFAPLLALSSTDVSIIQWFDFSVDIFIICPPVLCIVMSYICIFFVILQISSASGKMKAFSTCSSHLIVVCSYFVSLIMVYMAPNNESFRYENKLRSLLFVALTPFANPIVYSLRNYEIKEAIKRMAKNKSK
ncbi:olfactory receptor 2D3-like [Gastrophryne carolinensis]